MTFVTRRRVLRASACLLAVLATSPLRGAAQVPGTSSGPGSADLVRRALASNPDLAATRLDIDRARSRVRQAGAVPNPTIEYQQATGRFTGSPGEWDRSIIVALPIEVAGQRGRRIDLARIEMEAASAALADAERRLAAEVRAACADVLAAERELAAATELDRIDTDTARFVQVRVGEGESAPLELNLLKAEIDRQRSRRALVAGRRDAARARLKALVGAGSDEPLPISEDLAAPVRIQTPSTVSDAVAVALGTRPDVRLVRLEEQAALAGYNLVRSQSAPEVTLFGGYGVGQSIFDETPVGVLRDHDRMIAFGVSVSIPIFNRNQGARADASTAVAQARKRRESVESRVRAEVAAAFSRYRAASEAAATFESGVLDRSRTNVEAIRGAYQVGAYRITELLAEQRRLSDAEREFTDALAERYRALVDLESAVGIVVPAEALPASSPAHQARRESAGRYPGGTPGDSTETAIDAARDRAALPYVDMDGEGAIPDSKRGPK